MQPSYAASLRVFRACLADLLTARERVIAADDVQRLLCLSLAKRNYWYRHSLLIDAALLHLRLTLAYRARGGDIAMDRGRGYYQLAVLAQATERLR